MKDFWFHFGEWCLDFLEKHIRWMCFYGGGFGIFWWGYNVIFQDVQKSFFTTLGIFVFLGLFVFINKSR